MPVSGASWNRKAQRYIGPNGRFLSATHVRDIVDDNIDHVSHSIEALMQDLIESGQGGIDLWEKQMRRAIKSLHLSNAAAASGGFNNMTQADYGRAGQRIRYNYARLARWANELRNNPDMLAKHGAQQLYRASLYAENGRFTFEAIKRANHDEQGFGWEENILDRAAHHCEGPGSCLEATALGRVPIGTLLQVGARICGPQCRCILTYFHESE